MTRRQQTARIVRRSKFVACFMVASGLVYSWSVWERPEALFGFGQVVLVLIWIIDYFAINMIHATNQRLIMLTDILEAKDQDRFARFYMIPLSLHALALLTLSDPFKLYHPSEREWYYRR